MEDTGTRVTLGDASTVSSATASTALELELLWRMDKPWSGLATAAAARTMRVMNEDIIVTDFLGTGKM